MGLGKVIPLSSKQKSCERISGRKRGCKRELQREKERERVTEREREKEMTMNFANFCIRTPRISELAKQGASLN